jgi:uncharacterized protein (TIGR02246 family)
MGDEIRSHAFTAALARGDAASAASLYAADGALLTADAELLRGREEIGSYWREGIALGLRHLELDQVEVRELGDAAVELGRYVLVVDDASERGRYVVVHRREADGAWRRAVEVYNAEGER